MASATEIQITTALVAELNNLTGLVALHFPEPAMNAVCVFPLLEQEFNVDWGSDDGGNAGPLEGDLMVCTPVKAGNSREAAIILGAYLSLSGDKSINQLLHGSTLGGLVPPMRVKGMKKLETITFPDGRVFWARPITVKIFPG